MICHKDSASRYTSKDHTDRHKRQCGGDDADIPRKKTRRSLTGESTSPFDFKRHCLFCGNICNVEKDKKHPDRWRESYIFRELDKKQFFMEVCAKRNDDAAENVQLRLQGVRCDLHAEEARYHLDCNQKFTSFWSLPGEVSACNNEPQGTDADQSFLTVVEMLKNDRPLMWSSVELFEAYREVGGLELSRRTLVCELQETFGNELLVLSSPGIANIVAFRSSASQVLRLVNNEEDDPETVINKAGKCILTDLKDIDIDKKHYSIGMNRDLIKESVSEFLLKLLAKVSPKPDNTLTALLIGSIVTSVVKSQATSLQIDLAGKMGESKKRINGMFSYGVCSSYTEYRRFKKSAATAAAADLKMSGISSAADGLVQGIVDNFDAEISSQNGRQSTHSLAVLLTQHTQTCSEQEKAIQTIKRVPNHSSEVSYEVDVHRYQGPQRPVMPQPHAVKTVPTLKRLAHQIIANERASEINHAFFQDVLTKENCPEFYGYSTQLSREQGHQPQPKTKAIYMPLIDMKPSNPDTMLTAMVKVQDLSSQTGQSLSVLTCDQQLYRVAVQIAWEEPDRFNNMYLRFGGMHALMSFVGPLVHSWQKVGCLIFYQRFLEVFQRCLVAKSSPKMFVLFEC